MHKRSLRKLCERKCARQSNLPTHIESVHEGKKPFNFKLCTSSFVLMHQQQQKLKKLYECELCTKNFKILSINCQDTSNPSMKAQYHIHSTYM